MASLTGASCTYGLSLLLGEQLSKLWDVLLKAIGKSEDSFFSLSVWGLRPGFERLLCGCYSIVDILLRRHGNLWIRLSRSRIDAMSGLLGSRQFSVDGVIEATEEVKVFHVAD
jgi:hypothetical protein